jgi:hypothetical protein
MLLSFMFEPGNGLGQVFPVLSTNPKVIHYTDYVRLVILFLGLCYAALFLRAYITERKTIVEGTTVRAPGYMKRLIGGAFLIISATGTEAERLGDPLTLRLVFNLLGVFYFAWSLYSAAPVRRPSAYEKWLEEEGE